MPNDSPGEAINHRISDFARHISLAAVNDELRYFYYTGMVVLTVSVAAAVHSLVLVLGFVVTGVTGQPEVELFGTGALVALLSFFGIWASGTMLEEAAYA